MHNALWKETLGKVQFEAGFRICYTTRMKFSSKSVISSLVFSAILGIWLNLTQAIAATGTFDAEKKQAESILSQYSRSKSVKFEIEKVDEKKVLGTKKSTPGELTIAGAKFNLMTLGATKTEIISTGKKLWLVEHPDADFGGASSRKVSDLSKKQPALAKQIVQIFSNPKKFIKSSQIKQASTQGDQLVLELQPLAKELKSFEIRFDKAQKQISEISFVDDVDTTTTVRFLKVTKLNKIPQKKFEFKKKSSDEVF